MCQRQELLCRAIGICETWQLFTVPQLPCGRMKPSTHQLSHCAFAINDKGPGVPKQPIVYGSARVLRSGNHGERSVDTPGNRAASHRTQPTFQQLPHRLRRASAALGKRRIVARKLVGGYGLPLAVTYKHDEPAAVAPSPQFGNVGSDIHTASTRTALTSEAVGSTRTSRNPASRKRLPI